MKMFRNQQKILHNNAARAVLESEPDPQDKKGKRTRQIVDCYGVKNPIPVTQPLANNADLIAASHSQSYTDRGHSFRQSGQSVVFNQDYHYR